MVVPIKDLGNMTSDTPTFCATLNMAPGNNVTIGVNSFDALFQNACNNFDEVRGHLLTLSTYRPRFLLMSLSDYKEDYATRLEKLNDRIDEDEPIALSSSVQLEYVTPSS